MNILHIYKTYFPDTLGGCEYMIRSLVKQTSRMGCQNNLITLSNNSARYESSLDLNIIRFPIHLDIASCPMSIKMLYHFRYYAQSADIIHYHFPWPFADLLHQFAGNKPAIVTYHSDIVRQRFLKILYKPLMKNFLDRMTFIVPTSQNYLASSTDLQPYRNKCSVIHLGIDEQDYPLPDSNSIEQWRTRLGENFVLFIGVLRYYKGLATLIKAAEKADVPLVIIGNGPFEHNLRKQIINGQLTNVHLVGKVSEADKVALIKLCSSVVLPSDLRSEAFGVSLLEGLLFAKPLITTELNTGTSFVNQHNITGLVVKPKNVSELQDAITDLAYDKEKARSMGLAGRKHYEDNFTAEAMAKKYYALYTSLV